MKKKQKKKNGASVQALLGVKSFSEYGLLTTRGELLFFHVTPSNISVLSAASVEIKIHARCRNMNLVQTFNRANSIQKVISEQGFDIHRMTKSEIKRFLALYFDASMFGEQMPDYDGEQYFGEREQL